jgi:hypothetical protein
METILHDHFQCHFGQATGTPFTTSPLCDIFGYGGHNSEVDKLLDGHLEIPDITIDMKRLLNNFRRSCPALSQHFPDHNIMNGFQQWHESTTTSPSRKHLGIYRSISEQFTRTSNVHKIKINVQQSHKYFPPSKQNYLT